MKQAEKTSRKREEKRRRRASERTRAAILGGKHTESELPPLESNGHGYIYTADDETYLLRFGGSIIQKHPTRVLGVAEIRWRIRQHITVPGADIHQIQMLAPDLDIKFMAGLSRDHLAGVLQHRIERPDEAVTFHGRYATPEKDRARCCVWVVEDIPDAESQLVIEIVADPNPTTTAKFFTNFRAHDYLRDFFAIHVPPEARPGFSPSYVKLTDDGVVTSA